ncbi:MAG: hypothetical protein PVH29_07990, partial [Candidatus Zixiibacteriota bacterium]
NGGGRQDTDWNVCEAHGFSQTGMSAPPMMKCRQMLPSDGGRTRQVVTPAATLNNNRNAERRTHMLAGTGALWYYL